MQTKQYIFISDTLGQLKMHLWIKKKKVISLFWEK